MPGPTVPSDRERAKGGLPKPRRQAPPIVVRQVRNGVEESVHRGDIVEVDVGGRMLRALGDPDHMVFLRSAVKPFGILALLEAGGVAEFELETPEIAIMAASHSGEDLHVRTLQAMFRRTGVSQTGLALGTDGVPIDALTAARLARDGERPGEIRHMCSGYHAAFLLLARHGGWNPDGYWLADHPAQQAARDVVARAFATAPAKLVTGIDACGVPTYAFPLREIARGYAFLADPEAVPAGDPRAPLAGSMRQVRDAMVAHPEMVGGSRDRLDTSVAKALPGRIAAKGGAEGLRCFAILPGSARARCLDPRDRARLEGRGWRGRGSRDLRGGGRGPRPGGRPRRPGAADPRAVPPADRVGSTWPRGRGGDPVVRAGAGGGAARLNRCSPGARHTLAR